MVRMRRFCARMFGLMAMISQPKVSEMFRMLFFPASVIGKLSSTLTRSGVIPILFFHHVRLKMAVLATADGDHAVVTEGTIVAVSVAESLQLFVALSPVDLLLRS